jgi:hypothetical protein
VKRRQQRKRKKKNKKANKQTERRRKKERMSGLRIVGVGIDLVNIPRINSVLVRFGNRFLTRAFHPEEIAQYSSFTTRERGLEYLSSR